jgi:glycerol-3-phosphate dehydrogenase
MAEHVVDQMCEQLGDPRPCRTADEAVPKSESGANYLVTHRLGEREHDRLDDQVLCECELMTKKMFVEALDEQPRGSFDDLRRQLRLGMGPCQGGFCSMRATGVALETGHIDIDRATELLRLFLKNRWIGLWPILHGEQLRQTALDNWMFHSTLNIDHLPESTQEVAL